MPSPQLLPRMIVCSDCIHCDNSGTYERRAKFGSFFCRKNMVLVNKRTTCSFQVSRVLTERREQEKTQKPVETSVLLKRLEALMLCDAFDRVSGVIHLQSSYSHVADIKIHLGPTHRSKGYICSHCLHEGRLVADIEDIDKFYCDNCKRHTEPGYNDEVV